MKKRIQTLEPELFTDGVTLDGEFQAEGWQPEIDCEFGFDEMFL